MYKACSLILLDHFNNGPMDIRTKNIKTNGASIVL